jgi:hypothetical protein
MSLTIDGVWKAGAWATTVWADGVWAEGTPTPDPEPTVTGGFLHPYIKLRDDEYREAELQKELERVNDEIAAEQARLDALNALEAEKAAYAAAEAEQLKTLAMLQDEINALRMERARLIRLIDEEEAALVLLMSLPFH